MKAYRVALHGAQDVMNSDAPWTLWWKRFCLAACLAERQVQGTKQGMTARHWTRVIAGRRRFLSPPP